MLFNLEPGGVGYEPKHRLATVKVNDDEEGRECSKKCVKPRSKI